MVQKHKLLIRHFRPYKWKFAFFKNSVYIESYVKIDSLQQNPQQLLTNMYLNTSNTEGPTSPNVNKSQLQALPLLSGFSLNKSKSVFLKSLYIVPMHFLLASKQSHSDSLLFDILQKESSVRCFKIMSSPKFLLTSFWVILF